MATTTDTHTALARLDDDTLGLTALADALAGIFEIIEWAEDEIEQAIRRHPRHRDVLWHSFALIKPRETGPRIDTELLYRSHATELLERVVASADTRAATAAELVMVCREASLIAPMNSTGAGLFFRTLAKALPGNAVSVEMATQRVHYEKLFGSKIDGLQRDVDRKLVDAKRVHGEIDCHGYHHGEPVTCRFARTQVSMAPAPRMKEQLTSSDYAQPDLWGSVIAEMVKA